MTEHAVQRLLHEKTNGNVIFDRFAQKAVKICHRDFLKKAALKRSTKKAMTGFFHGYSSANPFTSNLQNQQDYLREFFKLLLHFSVRPT